MINFRQQTSQFLDSDWLNFEASSAQFLLEWRKSDYKLFLSEVPCNAAGWILITYPLRCIFWLHIHFTAIFWLHIHFTGYFDYISTSLDILISYPLHWIFWLHIHFTGYFDYISTSLDILITYLLRWIFWLHILFTG